MDINEIIVNALEYYDVNRYKRIQLTNNIKYYSIKYNDKPPTIQFYDNNQTMIYKSTFGSIGIYDNLSNIWIWAWSVPNFDESDIKISKKLLLYGLSIPRNVRNLFELKSELITSRFKITNDIQLETHISLAAYLSKKEFILGLPAHAKENYTNDILPIEYDYSNVDDNKLKQYIYIDENQL